MSWEQEMMVDGVLFSLEIHIDSISIYLKKIMSTGISLTENIVLAVLKCKTFWCCVIVLFSELIDTTLISQKFISYSFMCFRSNILVQAVVALKLFETMNLNYRCLWIVDVNERLLSE